MTQKFDDGGPAFPVDINAEVDGKANEGMSVRMWLAGQILSHALSHGEPVDQAMRALNYADALIAADKTPKPQGANPHEQDPNHHTGQN